jgi:hypothetical protein
MLFALSIQLCLYAAAWLLMGVAFGLARQAVVSWSSAWAVLALVTFWLSRPALAAIAGTPEVVNFAVVVAFVLQLWGTSKATQLPVSKFVLLSPIAGVLVVDGLRLFHFHETVMVRLALLEPHDGVESQRR